MVIPRNASHVDPTTPQFTRTDAWHIARFVAGTADLSIDALQTNLGRDIGQVLLGANGTGRQVVLDAYLDQHKSVLGTVLDALQATDPNGPEPAADPQPKPYQLYSLADAFDVEDDEPDWIVGDIVQRGCTTALVGGPGGKKTWAGLDMAICVATGKDWLNYPVQQGRVLVVDEESGPRRLGRRLRQTAQGHDVPPDAPLFYVSLEGFNLRDPVSLARLEVLLADARPDLVVLDSQAALTPGADENTVKDMQPIFNALRQLANRYELGFLLIHHANKDGRYRGSSAIKAGVDMMFVLESKLDSPVMDFVSEKVRDTTPFVFAATFNYDVLNDTSCLRRAGAVQRDEHLSASEDYALKYLTRNGPSAMADIMDSADQCSPQAARQAVYKLVNKGKVRRCNAGEKGVPAVFEAVKP